MEIHAYLIMTMARSGHHAFINWIGKNFPGEAVHYNNCVRGWEEGKFISYQGRRSFFNEGLMTGKIAKIMNIEDFDIHDFEAFKMGEFEIFTSCIVHPIIFVRDPRNWIASSMRLRDEYANELLDKPIRTSYLRLIKKPSRVELYKRQLRECLGITKMVFAPCIEFVSYPKWFSDSRYRTELSSKLSLMPTDFGMDDVVRWGTGSSFDKRSFQGKGSQMKVLDRWKEFHGHKRFNKITSDLELQELAKKFFGEYCQ